MDRVKTIVLAFRNDRTSKQTLTLYWLLLHTDEHTHSLTHTHSHTHTHSLTHTHTYTHSHKHTHSDTTHLSLSDNPNLLRCRLPYGHMATLAVDDGTLVIAVFIHQPGTEVALGNRLWRQKKMKCVLLYNAVCVII